MQRRLAIGMALWACAYGQAVFALGLGELSVESHLNQPFAASVPVFGVDDEALDSLQVTLASPEAYHRAGLNRPDELLNLRFEVVQGAEGALIRLQGDRPVREPLLSLLLQVRGDDGAVLREYAVLLDPPDMAAAQQPAAAAEPAPAPPRAAAPPAAVAAPAAAAAVPDTYGPVRNGETFWSVGTRLRPDAAVTMDQVLLSLYEANPQAFDNGSIDELLRGAVLRVPSRAEMLAVPPEVARRRMAALRAAAVPDSTRAAGTDDARVSGRGEATAAPAAPAEAQATVQPPDAAQAELSGAPTADIAASPLAADEPAFMSMPRPVPAPAAMAPVAEEPAVSPAPSPPSAGAELLASPVVASAAPAESPAPDAAPPPVATPAPVLPEAEQAGSIRSPLLIGALVLLALLLGWRAYRRRRDAGAVDERAHAFGTLAAGAAAAATGAAPGKGKVAMPYVPPQSELEMLDEALRRDEAAAREPAAAAPEAQAPPLEPPSALPKTNVPQSPDFDAASTLPADTVQLRLDGEDPLAEADFHLAYGLYDEAALLLRQAIEREPERTELRIKLADTYFAAQRPMEFLEVAERLQGAVPPPAWQRIAAMGRQLAPDARLFDPAAQAAAAAPAGTTGAEAPPDLEPLELDLSTFDLVETPPKRAAGHAALDFALEDLEIVATEPAATPAPAAEQAVTRSEAGNVLEFDLSELDLAMLDPDAPQETGGVPGDSPAPAPATDPDPRAPAQAAAAPQPEPQPAMFQDMPDMADAAVAAQPDAEDSALVEAFATAFDLRPQPSPDEAVDIDFSRIDLDDLDLDKAAAGTANAQTDWERALRELSIEPPIHTATPPAAESRAPADAESALAPLAALDVEAETFDLSSLTSEDFDPDEANFDSDEVATKLDLARAYVDMGDHEMARGLLAEVFLQGDATQKTEADGLLARLPV